MRAQVNLRHLEEAPQRLNGEVSPADLEFDKLGDEIIQPQEPLHYDVEVEKQDRNLLVSGSLQTNLDCQCVRCLKAFKYPLELKPYHLYVALEGEEAAPVVNDLVDLTPFSVKIRCLRFRSIRCAVKIALDCRTRPGRKPRNRTTPRRAMNCIGVERFG